MNNPSYSFETTARPPEHVFILFGVTGDLAKRKLLPALYALYRNQQLPEKYAVVGVARSRKDDAGLRQLLLDSLSQYARYKMEDDDQFESFADRFSYCSVDVSKPEEFVRLKEHVEAIEARFGLGAKNRMYYLAMAPEFFAPIATNLEASGLTRAPGWKRLIIEKPFGHDLASAQALNEQLRQAFEEDEIYRIDHYLGKEMVQNIEVIRFANSIFEPVWNNRSIASVQITSSETVGVEDRASYYENAGALRDMVQNHMLQMVMMIAMEPPSRLKTEAIRDEKVKVLRSLRRYDEEEVRQNVVRGQYQGGWMKGQAVPAYREEHGVARDSQTETFVAARLFIDNFRWAGVPFYIRTGKRLSAKATEIVIQFRSMPKNLYFNKSGNLGPNRLVIRVNPAEGMSLHLNAKRPDTDETVLPIEMEFSQETNASPEAYERLLLDAMWGDSTFFTRWDEVSLAWKWVDPIAHAFATDSELPLHPYAAGSPGPVAADALLQEDGFAWWPVSGEDRATPSPKQVEGGPQPATVVETVQATTYL
ncbi:glucose-6-phosphate dehydrogenase [Alicyclobacillus kakegawensis]|uniref:glucose-6-phosphate dehydrogenase n=1 Tax=Alicyclobacillus kakegawensis TaxID=392012 RepID=UPI00082B627B|nr:glucose-6-phosphate dehydrogenase [Alicyclobacillus kakegawensis]